MPLLTLLKTNQLISALRASRSTLVSITLKLAGDSNESLRLFQLHFPRLCALNLDIWLSGFIGTKHELTKFIVSHDETLEELILFNVANIGSSTENAFTSQSLPRLRSFKGFSDIVELMMERGMESLQNTLQNLDINFKAPYHNDPAIAFGLHLQFFEKVSRSGIGAFRSLRQLHFDLSYEPGVRHTDFEVYVHEVMGNIAAICSGTLEVWRGSIQLRFSIHGAELLPEAFAVAFSKFKILREIWLIRNSVSGEIDPKDYALRLAERCPKLESIILTDGNKEESDCTLIEISRDSSGEISLDVKDRPPPVLTWPYEYV